MVRQSSGLWIVVLAVALACCCAAAAGAAQFQEIGLYLNLPGCTGAAWGDYDGDGYPDLLISGSQPDYMAHPEYLLRNEGDLTFTDVSAQVGLPTTQQEDNGVAWADYDNDGLLDVLVGCAGTGYEKLYHREGAVFTDVATASGFNAVAMPTRSVSWCDYDGDNLLDAFVCKIFAANTSILYHNNGDGTFTDVTTAAGMAGLARPSSGVGAAWGDYDNDGHPDLMLSRYQLPALLYHNEGDGTFTEVSQAAGIAAAGAVDATGVAWADYDNDGWLDCYIGSYQQTRDWLFHNNGDGTFTDVAATAGMGADASIAVGVAWADYDNDGYLDLYVGNLETDNQPFLYHNRGDGTFADVAATSGLQGSRPSEVAAWADIDLDGRMDLFQGSSPSYLFHNLGPAGSWLRVQALTSAAGDATGADPVRDAIGARVEVNLDNDDSFAAGRTLTRLIDGGSGFLGQNEQIAHFGLGASALLAVRVRFPDGSVVVHRSVAANQQLIIRDVPADREEIFDDVPLDYWAYPAIAAALEAGIVQGYWDNTYRPAGQVDRASMAVYLARALAGGDEAVPEPSGDTPSFTDVGTDHWAYKYIEYAASPEANVVQGYPGGNYKPDDLVNRGQMAVYIARAMVTPSGDAGVPDPPAGDATFSDVTAAGAWSWCYNHVEYLAAEGIVQGYPDGTYHPATIVTRDQMAVYIARAFDLPL
jgi:hypothetical protein